MHAHPPRIYYDDLDIGRGVLMALGVILHSANLFHTDVFAQYGADANPAFYRLVQETVHLFRMPAFFAVSGFFCVMSLRRTDVAAFLKLRGRRILVPLVTVLLTLNMIELSLRGVAGAQTGAVAEHAGQTYWMGGFMAHGVLLHLWFLVVVFVYFCLAAGMFALFHTGPNASPGLLARRGGQLCRWAERSPVPALGLWLTLAVILAYMPHAVGMAAPAIVYTPWVFGVTPFTILDYAPFFVFGALLNFSPMLTDRWRRFGWLRLLLFVTALAAYPAIARSGVLGDGAMVGARALAAWICVLTLFGLFNLAARAFSRSATLFAEPAYTIYLLHHILVFTIGWAMIANGVVPAIAFPALIGIVLAITVTVHFAIVRRVPALRLLLNGK